MAGTTLVGVMPKLVIVPHIVVAAVAALALAPAALAARPSTITARTRSGSVLRPSP